ncbi:MAG: hypothetical protein ABW223_00320 [Rariglobus sp.]
MDWIGDHLQLIIAIAGAIAYWLNARRKDKAGEPADYDGDGEPDNQPRAGGLLREEEDAMQQEENTRRIQEEIRRKIAERQGGARTPPPLQPSEHSPVPALPTQAWRREQAETRNANEYRRIESEREASAVLERQHALAAQLAALNERRAEASREAKSVWIKPAAAKAAGATREDHELLSELRDARSLRRAIITREVLGTPVGLR